MSVRKNAPYADEFDEKTGNLIYEGHYAPKNISDKPKEADQLLTTTNGAITENGKFFTGQCVLCHSIENLHYDMIFHSPKAGLH